MSILSAQCERLRLLANNMRQTTRGHNEYISAMRDAADTIWQLRNTSLDTANENDELKAENSELRERIGELEELTDGKRYIPQEWYAQLQAENAKLRELVRDMYRSMDVSCQFGHAIPAGTMAHIKNRVIGLGVEVDDGAE